MNNKKFMKIWISQILSQVTINVMNFVLLIKLFEHTGSAIATSFLWVCYALPAIIIGPVAAALVDIIDRRKILMITNLLQGLVILIFAIFQPESYFLLYGLVIAYSFLNQFYVPAESATIPSVLSKDQLPHGNSLFFLTQQSALILGFGGAGILSSILGFQNTLFLCSVLLFIAFVSVTLLPKLKVEIKNGDTFEGSFLGFFRRIFEGYSYIKDHKTVAVPLALLLGIQVFLAVITVNVPLLAKDVFMIDLNYAGIFIIVPAALGSFSCSFILPKLLNRNWRKKKIVQSALIITAVLCLAVLLVLDSFGIVYRVASGIAISYFLGVAFVSIAIPSQTFLQEVVPGGMRGRVFGNFWFLVTVVSILPTVFSSTISEIFGIKFLFLLLGSFALTVFLLSKKYWK